MNLKILKDDSSCPGACQVIKWVKGCFDALDKKYLKMLMIGIYVNPDDPDTVIESYTFKFSYTEEGGIDIYRVKLQIKTDGRQFQAQEDELQTNVDGQQISDEGLDNEEEVMDVTEHWQENIADACVSPDTLSHQAGGKQVIIEPTEADSAPSQTPAKPGCDDQAVSQLGSSQRSNMDEGWEEDLGVRCGCGCNEDDGLMILCASCKHWQHGVCYLILTEEEAPERHICEICGNPDDPSLAATDPHLYNLKEVAVQKDVISSKSEGEAVSQENQSRDKRAVDEVIGQLTTQAKCLDISGKRPKLPSKVEESCLNKENEPVAHSSRKRRDKRRVKAIADSEEHQFEVADSQELSQSQDYDNDCSRRKRRKSSVASRAILV
ncbi:hypothetical protein NP493_271g02031 [Ridgeia piscesae]|uniref:Zinc finger PHD-type domain-containing protein n=1 Tax=Ridgeia piscesae TaxID=27915 RepID=A0AAD9NXK9_RIDPI|nr:hypothetical protein NP493_271g02031 [Ridgeia piscesae]